VKAVGPVTSTVAADPSVDRLGNANVYSLTLRQTLALSALPMFTRLIRALRNPEEGTAA
jgi:hypothetical protein